VAAYRVVGKAVSRVTAGGATLASYVDLNMAGAPELARRFVATCREQNSSSSPVCR